MSRMEENQKKSYYWFVRSEKIIIKVLIIIMALLIIIQYLYIRKDIAMDLNSIESLEGKSISEVKGYLDRGTIELQLSDTPIGTKKPKVLINGDIVAEFNKNSVIIDVMDNDIVEVDGVGIQNSLTVKVASISDNIEIPLQNFSITIRDSIAVIDKVKLK